MEIISYKFLVLLVQRQEEEKKEKERKVKEQQRLINTQARGQAKKKVNRFDSSFFYLFLLYASNNRKGLNQTLPNTLKKI